MGKAIVNDLTCTGKSARFYYTRAYSDLRAFYALCSSHQFSDDVLMEKKNQIWRDNGKYLDIVFQHYFAKRVSEITGIGSWHGWHNAQRLHAYARDWSKFYTRCVLPF